MLLFLHIISMKRMAGYLALAEKDELDNYNVYVLLYVPRAGVSHAYNYIHRIYSMTTESDGRFAC